MNEKDIKAIVLDFLISTKSISRSSIISSEYVIAGSAVRADLAILSTEYIGVEIKSRKDSLKRLESQIFAYRSYFDRVIIVLATKHFKTFNPQNYPSCEVLEIDMAGAIRIHKKPPTIIDQKQKSLLDLLTQAELRRFYELPIERRESSCAAYGNKRFERNAFESAFKAKFENSSQEFWAKVGRRKISADHLELLSRFRDQRDAARRWRNDRERQNQSWITKLHTLQNLHSELA